MSCQPSRKLTIAWCLALLVLSHGCAGAQRTELCFGLSRPDGSLVTAEQWDAFVDQVVTPRFPEGLTIIDARGQYRDSRGQIIHEPAKVIILFHETNDRRSRAIEEIRDEFKSRFEQESVLRVTSGAKVQQ